MKTMKTDTKPLFELCTKFKSGGTPRSDNTAFYGGSIPFVTIDDMTSSSKYLDKTTKTITDAGLNGSNCWKVPADSILYSIYATLGVARINKIEVTTNQAILALVPDNEKIDTEYLYYYLSYLQGQIYRYSAQTTQSNLNAGIVKNFPILYLDPKEQSKIAEILATIDRAIAQTEALIAKHQRIKTGLMQDLLTRGIDEHGQLRDPSTHRFKSAPLGIIPEEWDVKPLGTIADINSGVTLGRRISGDNTIELPYLRVANVQDGYLDLSEIKTVRIYKNELSRFALEKGDVLMNEGGDFDKLGRGTVWEGQISLCLHQNHVFRVRTNRDELLPEFLAAVSSSQYGKKFFVLSSKQSTNLASINSTQLKGFPIPRPSTDEQRVIMEVLNSHEANTEKYRNSLDKLNRIKQGLMQDLLSGRVSVEVLME